ncbi:MAG: histidine--tRNA ligase [Lachnospiraceae bacterium]|nr:histidine--tRNA ligase [Candidatus Minthocola equi]
MALIKKPVNGMKDILPAEMEIRDYLIGLIKDTYRSFGFTPIETPVVESLPNLLSKQGGDNEKLIFKVMKRGEKLRIDEATCEDDLADSGLRYDLTVPLVRYYANNANDLPRPFKALQIGPVFRADRPQKGRFREFYQCDIDILGEPTTLAETELILATSTLLGRVGFKGFTVKINDRRLLRAMAAYAGIKEEDYDKAFIILDKYDKIGIEGVTAELCELGYDEKVSGKYTALFAALETAEKPLDYLISELAGFIPEGVIEDLKGIIASVQSAAEAEFKLQFDPTLVRGMSYYTGPIFEIAIDGLASSCGGGGRYDKMVEKFLGQSVPACGFSIGFERIITILLDQGYKIPGSKKRIAYLIEKGMPGERVGEIMKQAADKRKEGYEVSVNVMAKNKKFQKEQLSSEGTEEFVEFYINPLN